MKRFFLIALLLLVGQPAHAAERESAYDRVMRTGTIRCGYRSWPPSIQKDPNTGQLSGIYYDYVMKLGELLSLKIDWTEELGAGEFIAALQAGRIDVMCYGAWPTAARGRSIDFVQPLYYDALFPFVRAGDQRFDKDIGLVNDPAYKMGAIDGSASASITAADFPRATIVGLTEMNTGADLFLQLAEGKVDMVMNDLHTAKLYEGLNPGKIRQVPIAEPLRLYGTALSVAKGEQSLLNTLNTATSELVNSGAIEKMIRAHEKYPGSFYRVAKPYQAVP